MNVRCLIDDAAGLRGRFGEALAADDAAALEAATDARILALDGAPPAPAQRLLLAAGVRIARAGGTTLFAVTRESLERARARAAPAEAPFVADLLAAFRRAGRTPLELRVRGRALDLTTARVMGIVNVTPDSFFTRVADAGAALAQAHAQVRDGAAVIDIGGQSYAAGLRRIGPVQERERVVPAIRALAESGADVTISVDTVIPSVADAALAAGAHLINDCSGLADPALADVAAKHAAGLVVMHLKGRLNVRDPAAYVYRDALAEIVEFLHERTQRALAAGVARDAIAVDPGLEFGKEPHTDLEILARFGELRSLGFPIVLAASRKSFLSRLFGRPAADLLVPSLAAAAIGITAGARIVRAHDVAETVLLARTLAAAARPSAGGNSNWMTAV